MNEQKELPRRILQTCLKIVAIVLLVIFLLLFLALGVIQVPLDMAVHMVFGWALYLARVIPQVQFNPEIALHALVALGFATYGLHRILRWWRQSSGGEDSNWHVVSTFKVTAMMLLLFATSVAATGISHQLGWLFSSGEPLVVVYGRSAKTRELMMVRNLSIAILHYTEAHPEERLKSLDQLITGDLGSADWLFSKLDKEPPERFLFFPVSDDPNPGNPIIAASPRPDLTYKRAVARLDGDAEWIDEAEFQKLIREQTERNRTTTQIPASR